jgi:hypothetical protein
LLALRFLPFTRSPEEAEEAARARQGSGDD